MKSHKQIFPEATRNFSQKTFSRLLTLQISFLDVFIWIPVACRAPKCIPGSTEEPPLAGNLTPILLLFGIPVQGVFL